MQLENKITILKSSLDELHRLEMTEERINEVEVRCIKFTQSEQQIENSLVKKMNRASETYGTITLDLTFVSLELQKEKSIEIKRIQRNG